MTPAQLRAFSTVVRLGTVKAAAAELGVSEAAVSGHVAQLRKELGDTLFARSRSGLAFTPGGLRLATRGNELLRLQEQTVREVSEAGGGRRILRLAVSSLFGEYAAPGLIGLFSTRADDLDVEMSVRHPGQFEKLLLGRSADMAIGPSVRSLDDALSQKPFLKYQVVLVVGPTHPLAGRRVSGPDLARQTWMLGPEAADGRGVVTSMVEANRVPEINQRIFQSHAAALEETRRGHGVGLAVEFAVAQDLAAGRLFRVDGPGTQSSGSWSALALAGADHLSAAAELGRFITTPRATQAMLNGSGADIARFRPSVHITLWR